MNIFELEISIAKIDSGDIMKDYDRTNSKLFSKLYIWYLIISHLGSLYISIFENCGS